MRFQRCSSQPCSALVPTVCLLKRALDGRRRIRENRLVAEVDIGFAHQVGKYPCHAAIGDEIRNHGQLTICRFCMGP